MTFPYTITDQTVSVLVAGRLYQADRSSASWDRIKAALSNPDTTETEIVELLSPIVAFGNAAVGVPEIEIRGGAVWFGNEVVHSALADRILDIAREGLPLESWVAFANKVYANPSTYARDEFYTWIEESDLPITADGDFIAYKGVKADYTDNYSGTFDNHVGRTVTMPGGRAACDQDRNNDCSAGLHFCSKGYLPFGEKVMLIKVNPEHVVSFPPNSRSKGRTWQYTVVGEVDPEEARRLTWAPVVSDDGSDWYADEDGCYDDLEYPVEVETQLHTEHNADWPVLIDSAGNLIPEVDSAGYARVGPDPDLERLLAEEEAIETGEPFITTERWGILTPDRFRAMLVAAGGKCSTLARQLDAPKGTVRRWKKKLL